MNVVKYYEVAPVGIIRQEARSFTYQSEDVLPIGAIVEIEVGAKSFVGLVIDTAPQPSYETKSIVRLLEPAPLPEQLVRLALWMSDYYGTHLGTVLQTLLPRGLAKTRRASRDKAAGGDRTPTRDRTHIVFTKDQSAALDTLSAMSPGSALLHGVTGSGKTAVYIELAKRELARGASTIVLVPEIALTSQLVDEFSHHFNDLIVTHSKQTEAERHIIWQQALRAETPLVVIGPRSALFTPLPRLGLVVIDEAHEPSYKQEQAPRYSALRAARVLTEHHDAKLVYGSATPNVADYYLAEQSNRPIITMPKPAKPVVQPTITLVDMTKRHNFKKHHFFSDELLARMTSTLENGEQVLLFHNRRGTTTTTLCDTCGWQAGCPRCFVPLTLHADRHALRCHICGFHDRVPTSCPVCGEADVIHKGIGTKRIESELRTLFPSHTTARFDGDTAASESVDARYSELYSGAIDIIVGTQVVAKGLDLPHLRTVGIVQADAGLSLPDYTANERTFQLLAQAIGRIGRDHNPTTAVVQSYQPNHHAVTDGLSQDYAGFYTKTIAERRRAGFPPFTFLLKLTCVYKTEAAAIKNAKALAATLRPQLSPHTTLLGPTPAFYERQRDTFRWQLVVKSPSRQELQALLALVPRKNWQFELDPISLL